MSASTDRLVIPSVQFGRVAGVLVLAYSLLFVVSASRCANGLTRPDNRTFLVVSVVGAALLLFHDRIPSTLAMLAAGGLAGMYFQPSSSGVVSLALLAIGLNHIRRAYWSPRSAGPLLGGFVVGVVLLAGLMRLIGPADLPCL